MSVSITNSVPPFPQLGTEITLKILSYLDRPGQLRFFCVSKGAQKLKELVERSLFSPIQSFSFGRADWQEYFGAEVTDDAPLLPTTSWTVVNQTDEDPAPPAPRIARDVDNYFDQIGAGLLRKFF